MAEQTSNDNAAAAEGIGGAPAAGVGGAEGGNGNTTGNGSHLSQLSGGLWAVLTNHSFLAIALPGAIGGLVAWLIGFRVYPLIESAFIYWSLFFAIIFGSFSGLIMVILLQNVENRDTLRLLIISFLAGLAYPIVINKGLESLGVETELGLTVVSNRAKGIAYTEIESRALGLTKKRGAERDQIVGELRVQAGLLGNYVGELDDDEATEVLAPMFEELDERLPDEVKTEVWALFREAGMDPIEYLDDQDQTRPPDMLDFAPRGTDGELSLNEEMEFGAANLRTHWIPVTVNRWAEYTIEAFNDNLDLVAGIYHADGRNLVMWDDDRSSDDLNPMIAGQLQAGNYYIRISDYEGRDIDASTIRFKLRDPMAAAEAADPEVTRTFTPDSTDVRTFMAGTEFRVEPSSVDQPEELVDISFRVERAGTYRIQAISDLTSDEYFESINDLVAELYDNDGELLVADDDSAGDYNPEIVSYLEPQRTYHLSIVDYNYGDPLAGFRIVVDQHEPAAR